MNMMEFQKAFGDEKACLMYLTTKRWGKDQKDRYCPHCGSYETYAFKNGVLYTCKDCHKQFTVKVGTIFTDSKVPLSKWFFAIYLATSMKKGISSIQLSKYIGVTQKTAWFMLQRIRYAMESDSGDPLSGSVEVDETYVGGRPRAYQRAHTKDKGIVFGAIERNGGKARITHVKSAGARVLLPKIKEDISEGTLIYSDQARAYRTLNRRGYEHYSVNHSQWEFVTGVVHTQNIEAAWSHFKRSLYGVYHSVSLKHLQKYCSEFEYRYNTRTMDDKERFDEWFKKLHTTLPYRKLIYER